jgi:hypothetical protein
LACVTTLAAYVTGLSPSLSRISLMLCWKDADPNLGTPLLISMSIATHWRVDMMASSKSPRKTFERIIDVIKTKAVNPIFYPLLSKAVDFIIIR